MFFLRALAATAIILCVLRPGIRVINALIDVAVCGNGRGEVRDALDKGMGFAGLKGQAGIRGSACGCEREVA